jgi:hypothetical protein
MELTPAGLPRKLVLYCGRHDFGTVITARTGNLKAVMKVMGHKDTKTALRYQHPELDIVRAALNSNPGGVAAQPTAGKKFTAHFTAYLKMATR